MQKGVGTEYGLFKYKALFLWRVYKNKNYRMKGEYVKIQGGNINLNNKNIEKYTLPKCNVRKEKNKNSWNIQYFFIYRYELFVRKSTYLLMKYIFCLSKCLYYIKDVVWL